MKLSNNDVGDQSTEGKVIEQSRRRQAVDGFSLLELLIVVAIIGILAAIVVPVYNTYRVRAFNAAAESDLRNFKTAMESSYSDSQSYPPL